MASICEEDNNTVAQSERNHSFLRIFFYCDFFFLEEMRDTPYDNGEPTGLIIQILHPLHTERQRDRARERQREKTERIDFL